MSILEMWKEKEGIICNKIRERQAHNLELGKLPEMLAHTRKRINQQEMYIKTGNAMYLFQ